MSNFLRESEIHQKVQRHPPVHQKKKQPHTESQNSLDSEESKLEFPFQPEQEKKQDYPANDVTFERTRSRDSEELEIRQNKCPGKKRGRPPKFNTNAERRANKLERDRINQKNYRERKKTNANQKEYKVNEEIKRLTKVIELQKIEIQTLRNLRKFPSLTNELDTILSKKSDKVQRIFKSSEWIEDQDDQIQEILNCEYHKYVAQLLQTLEQQTADAINAVESFLIRFVKQSVENIEKAYEECSNEIKQMENSPSRHQRASPFKGFTETSFSDFLKGMIYSTHQDLNKYAKLLRESKYQLKLKQGIDEFNKACKDYQMAGFILKEKAQELRQLFSSPVDPFKYLSSADFAFILFHKNYLQNNVSDFNLGIVKKLQQQNKPLKYSEGETFSFQYSEERKEDHDDSQHIRSSECMGDDGSFSASLLEQDEHEIYESPVMQPRTKKVNIF